jgi:DNA processing protein
VDLTPWIALSLTDHVGSKTLAALLAHFGDDPHVILGASLDELRQVPGVGSKIASSIQAINLDQIAENLDRWAEAGLSVALFNQPDTRYPRNLLDQNVDDPPLTLFMRNPWQSTFDHAAAIVGTRTPTPQAETVARQLGQKLAENNITVVSGLARGIDTAAHEGALAVKNGCTVAVLGSGVQNIYPPENVPLAQSCLQRGCILSEVAPDAPPSAARLVARNRIISGLSHAVIVVETPADGGAMHAARFAYRQGRPVFTLDLPASGNQTLLENGALCLNTDLNNLDLLLSRLENHHA